MLVRYEDYLYDRPFTLITEFSDFRQPLNFCSARKSAHEDIRAGLGNRDWGLHPVLCASR